MKGTIRTRREFDAVYTHGVRRHGRFSVIFFLADDTRRDVLGAEGAEEVRVGIVASRRVGNAVHRNRAKRVLREASRDLVETLGPGSRMVIVARRTMREDAVRTPAVEAELRRMVEECRRDTGDAGAAS